MKTSYHLYNQREEKEADEKEKETIKKEKKKVVLKCGVNRELFEVICGVNRCAWGILFSKILKRPVLTFL